MKGTNTIFRLIIITLAVFIFTFSISIAFLVLGSQKIFAADVSSINIPSSYVNIGSPKGLVMLPDGNIWYVDNSNFRIVLYNPNTNTIIRTVGRLGTGEGEFEEQIRAITVDNEGYLYVINASCWLYKLDANGGFISLTELRDIDPVCDGTTTEGIHYDAYSDSIFVTYRDKGLVKKFSKNISPISSFGGVGSGDYEFNFPLGITTDANGLIYVADTDNQRIQVFSPTYTHLLTISGPWDDIGGTTGFSRLTDVLVLSDGTITASSANNGTIEQFSADGTHIQTWTPTNNGSATDLRTPEYLTKDNANNIYVADTWFKAVSKFNSTGSFINSLRNSSLTNNKFYYPTDVTYCPNGNMYVVDGSEIDNARVQEFSNSGTWLATILTTATSGFEYNSMHITCNTDGDLWVSSYSEVNVFTKISNTWTLLRTINAPSGGGLGGIAFSGDDLYIPNRGDNNIMKFTFNIGSGEFEYASSFGGGWNREGDPREAPDEQLVDPRSVVIDDQGHFFVADWESLKEYDESEIFVRNLGTTGTEGVPGTVQSVAGISIDPINDNLYMTDSSGTLVNVYDNLTGEIIRIIGNFESGRTYGGGQLHFSRPINSEINPTTGKLTIVDTENSRLQAVTGGNRIINLISSADVIIRSGDNTGGSLSNQAWDPGDFSTPTAIPARLMFGDYVVADFTVNLTVDRDWSSVNVQFLPATSKSLVVNLNTTDAPGISATHSLYLYRYNNQTEVTVCPEALTLSDLNPSCASEFSLTLDSPTYSPEGNAFTATLSTDTIEGKSYWIIDGLIGTGAFSNLFETSFQLRDLMTRLQVSTGSDHRLEFGTSYDLTHVGDTIKVTFAPEWDLSGLAITDLSLLGAGYPMTLSTSGPDTDVWGYERTDNVLTFTAPTGGIAQYIDAGSTIVLIISNAAVINPNTPESYQINMRLDSNTNPGPADVETGSVDISIVDSDTVNITAFVNAFMSFDIDTGVTSGVNCNLDSCLTHENGSAADNYTVDLGELKSTYVNLSQETRMHSDGISGAINSIYFDLSTNAQGGAVVTVTSVSDLGLQGPSDSNILPVDDASQINVNDGLYGFSVPISVATMIDGYGIETNTSCDEADIYCGPLTTPKQVFNTTDNPIDTARVRVDIAAAAAYTNAPGLYEDTLTFVATSTF